MTRTVPRTLETLRAILALTIISFLGAALAPSPANAQQNETPVDGTIHVWHVQGNVYMLVGDGANITAQVGDDGVLLVDTGLASMSDKLLETVKTISDLPIRYIVDTSDDPDHVGGNENISKAGRLIIGGNVVGDDPNAGNSATIVAYQTILDRMSTPEGKQSPTPQAAWPSDVYESAQKSIWFNGESIRIFHQPGVTDGDSLVYFRHSDVISAGDIFRTDGYPYFDPKRGGSIQGIIDGLNRLLYLTIPADDKSKDEGGTMVVPGHGRVCDQADVVVYQEMVTIIRDRVQALINKGMTLEQVKEAKPTLDYDPRYGTNTGSWTTDMFIEAVYNSLKTKH